MNSFAPFKQLHSAGILLWLSINSWFRFVMTTADSQGDLSPTINPMRRGCINQEFPLELAGGRWSPTMEWAQQISRLNTKRHSNEIGNLFMSQDFCSGVVSTLPWIQISSNSLLLSLRLSKHQHPDNLLVSKANVLKSLDSTWRRS